MGQTPSKLRGDQSNGPSLPTSHPTSIMPIVHTSLGGERHDTYDQHHYTSHQPEIQVEKEGNDHGDVESFNNADDTPTRLLPRSPPRSPPRSISSSPPPVHEHDDGPLVGFSSFKKVFVDQESNRQQNQAELQIRTYHDPFSHLRLYTGLDEGDHQPYYDTDPTGFTQPKFVILEDGNKVVMRHDWVVQCPKENATQIVGKRPSAKLLLPDGREMKLHPDSPVPHFSPQLQYLLENHLQTVMEAHGVTMDDIHRHFPLIPKGIQLNSTHDLMKAISLQYGGVDGRLSPLLLTDPGKVITKAHSTGATRLPDNNDNDSLYLAKMLTPGELQAIIQEDPDPRIRELFSSVTPEGLVRASQLVEQPWPTDLRSIKQRQNDIRSLLNIKSNLFNGGGVVLSDRNGVSLEEIKRFGKSPSEDLLIPSYDGYVPDIANFLLNPKRYRIEPFPEYFPVRIPADYASKTKKELPPNRRSRLPKVDSPHPFNLPRLIDFAHYMSRDNGYKGLVLPYGILQKRFQAFRDQYVHQTSHGFKISTRPDVILLDSTLTANHPYMRSNHIIDIDGVYNRSSNTHGGSDDDNSHNNTDSNVQNRKISSPSTPTPIYFPLFSQQSHSTATSPPSQGSATASTSTLTSPSTFHLPLMPTYPSPNNSLITSNELVKQPIGLHSTLKTLTNPHTLLTSHGLPATTSTNDLSIQSTIDPDSFTETILSNSRHNLPTPVSIQLNPVPKSFHPAPLSSSTRTNQSGGNNNTKVCGEEMSHYAHCIDFHGTQSETRCLPQLQIFLQCKRSLK